MRKRLLIAAIPVLLAAAITARVLAGEPTHCSLIGCDDGFAVDATDVAYTPSAAQALRLCVGERCEVIPRRHTGGFESGLRHGARAASPVPVTAELLGAGGRVLHRSDRQVDLSKLAPNGEKCGPICFVGSVRVDRHGDLQPPGLARPNRLAVLYGGRAIAGGGTLLAEHEGDQMLVDTPRPARRIQLRPRQEGEDLTFALDDGRQRWVARLPERPGRLRVLVEYADGGEARMTVRVRTP